jgi:hypothetical protein
MKSRALCCAGLLLSSLFLCAQAAALPFRLFTGVAFIVPVEKADEDLYRTGITCDVGCGAIFLRSLDVVAGAGFERVRANVFAPSYLELPSAYAGVGYSTTAVPGLRLRAGAETGVVFAGFRFLSTMATEDTALRAGFELSAAKSLNGDRLEIEPFAGAQWYFLDAGESPFYQEIRAGIRINFNVTR